MNKATIPATVRPISMNGEYSIAFVWMFALPPPQQQRESFFAASFRIFGNGYPFPMLAAKRIQQKAAQPKLAALQRDEISSLLRVCAFAQMRFFAL